MTLKKQVARGSLWALLDMGGQQLISFVVFIYIARILTPGAVGLVALAVIGIDLFGFISRFGQVEALQRDQPPVAARLNAAFWLTLTFGLISTLGVELAAYVIKPSPEHQNLPAVIAWLAPLCLIQAVNTTPEALLRGQMDYRRMALRSWTGTLLGGAVALIMANLHFGVFVLVGQRLVTTLTQCIGLWIIAQWRPTTGFSLADVRHLLKVGSRILFSNLAGMVSPRAADAITGTVLGVTQLGFLRLGWRLYEVGLQVSVTPVSLVTLSMFSRLRDDRDALRRAYLRMTQLVSLLSLPIFFGLGSVAHTLIPAFFGARWDGAAIVLQLLGFMMIGGTVNYFFNSAMLAINRSDIMLKQSVAQLVITALVVPVSVLFGLTGVMIGQCVRTFAASIYNITALKAELDIGVRDIAVAIMPPVVSSGVMWLVVMSVQGWLNTHPFGVLAIPYLELFALVSVGALAYLASLLAGAALGLWPRYIKDLINSLRGILER